MKNLLIYFSKKNTLCVTFTTNIQLWLLPDWPIPPLIMVVCIVQHSQAMLERGVCELAHFLFHLIGCSKPVVYGSNCNLNCPINCRYRTCHIQNGTCFGCEAGYRGTICVTGIFSSVIFKVFRSNGKPFYYCIG